MDGLIDQTPPTTPPAEPTPTPTPPAEPTALRELLPEDLRDHASFKDIKDVPALAKSFVHAQSMVGADKILKPQPDWKPEQLSEFFNSIGRPETPEGYKTPDLGLGEGMSLNEDTLKRTFTAFHNAGVTQQQADDILKFYADDIKQNMQQAQEENARIQSEGMEALRGEWKNDFDMNLNTAKSMVKNFADADLAKRIEESGLGNDPGFIKMMATLGKAFVEDSAGNTRGPSLSLPDETQAQHEIARLKGDEDFQKKLLNRDVLGHAEAVALWEQLHKAATPKERK